MNPLYSLLRSRRLWGLTGTALVLYFVVFVVFGRVDVSWLMPPTTQIARAILDVWPRMPFFAVQKESVTGSNGREIYYTVPTRQFTPQELKRMGVTNGVAHPAEPR